MSQAAIEPRRPSQRGEPAWEIVDFFPVQGDWTEEEYLRLSDRARAEFDDGVIEVLPMPTKDHELIALFMYELVKAFIAQRKIGGLVFLSGYHLKVRDGKLRRPDVLYLTPEQNALSEREFTRNAQWVAEVVSEDDPRRDYVKKRADYAACGVKEYWIVDPRKRLVTILFLEAGAYVERGSFGDGQRLASILFDGLTVGVSELFAAGEQ